MLILRQGFEKQPNLARVFHWQGLTNTSVKSKFASKSTLEYRVIFLETDKD